MLATIKLPGFVQGSLRCFGLFLTEWFFGSVQFSEMR